MSRMIGTVDIDDGTNAHFDFSTESTVTHNTYEQRVLAGGALVKTRTDKIAAVVFAQGLWFDTASKKFRHDFKDALLALDGVAMDLKDGLAYAKVDVIEVTETNAGIVGNASGTLLKAYRWSLKIQTYLGSRV